MWTVSASYYNYHSVLPPSRPSNMNQATSTGPYKTMRHNKPFLHYVVCISHSKRQLSLSWFLSMVVLVVLIVNLHSPHSSDRRGSLTSDWPVSMCVGIYLSTHWFGSANPTMSNSIPWQIGLGCIIKLVKYGPENEPVKTISLCFLLQYPIQLSVLSDGLWPTRWNEAFPTSSWIW